MKLGIITNNIDSPMAKVLEIIAMTKSGLEAESFTFETFQPSYVSDRNLDALLIQGQSETDAGYALAVKRHMDKPLLYLTIDFSRDNYTPNLLERGIEVYHVLDSSEHKGAESLIARLQGLGRLGEENDR